MCQGKIWIKCQMSEKVKEVNRGKDGIMVKPRMACSTPPKEILMLFSVFDANEKLHGYKIDKSQFCQ